MTLAEWLRKYSAQDRPYGSNSATRHLFSGDIPHEDARWELFHLTDYVVSSAVSGPAYVLVQR